MAASTQIHAACVSLDGRGVLLLGPSGSGKSDLALRLIEQGAQLVADDRVDVSANGALLTASPPGGLKGKIEARGAGIFEVPYVASAPLALAVELAERETVERLPEPRFWGCLGQEVPLISLHAFDLSTPAKIRLVLSSLG